VKQLVLYVKSTQNVEEPDFLSIFTGLHGPLQATLINEVKTMIRQTGLLFKPEKTNLKNQSRILGLDILLKMCSIGERLFQGCPARFFINQRPLRGRAIVLVTCQAELSF